MLCFTLILVCVCLNSYFSKIIRKNSRVVLFLLFHHLPILPLFVHLAMHKNNESKLKRFVSVHRPRAVACKMNVEITMLPKQHITAEKRRRGRSKGAEN